MESSGVRILGRVLARELTACELEFVSGGVQLVKTQSCTTAGDGSTTSCPTMSHDDYAE